MRISKMSKRKVKNILINKKFQIKYMLWMIIPSVIVAFSYASLFYYFISENYLVLVDLNPLMSEDVQAILYQELNQLIILIIFISLFFTLTVAFISFYSSSKTAGPLYRFKSEFETISKGKLNTRIKLRPSDDFQDVALAFNKMMDTIENKK
jgi:methyl-accepting chemotaxis protein